MISRSESLAHAEAAAAQGEAVALAESVFRLLYDAPTAPVLAICTAALTRYAPASARARADELLADPGAWVAKHGRELPDDPADLGPGDAAFLGALDGLLLAASCPARPGVFTVAAFVALDGAAEAHASRVWETADPAVVALWLKLNAEDGDEDQLAEAAQELARRNAVTAPAAVAARGASWRQIADDLRAAGIDRAPPSPDPARMEADLAHWREHEYMLIAP